MQKSRTNTLACCTAGLQFSCTRLCGLGRTKQPQCARSNSRPYLKSQQAIADTARPVVAHSEAASVEIEDLVGRTDQLANSHSTVKEVDQEMKQVAAEEDAASTDACSSFKVSVLDPSFKLSVLSPGASVASAAASPAPAGASAELEAAQAAAAPADAVSARIVDQSGKFYTIEMPDADQQNGEFGPSRTLTRRYREFAALDMELRPRHQALPALPQKSVFFRRTFKCGFMNDREQRLSAYLAALVADPSIVEEPSVQRFLGIGC